MVNLDSFISVDSTLAILSIVIGVTIFWMQQRADAKINSIITTLFKRQELEKKYFGSRVTSKLELVRKNYLKLEQYLEEYLKDHSQTNKDRVKNFSVFHSNNLDEYIVPSLRSDLGHLIEFLNDLNLVDQLSSAFDDFSSLFKDCSVDSVFEESDSSLREKIESAQEQSKLIESLLSRFAQEIKTTLESSLQLE